MKRVAVIYHYLALYRLPIFQELMISSDIEYTIYSGETSEIEIKKIDKNYSLLPVEKGGLRWKFLKNRWFFKKFFLWQHGLIKTVLRNEFDDFIFLGSPYHFSTWLAAAIARLKGKRVYFWMHGINNQKLTLVDRFKIKFFYSIANGYFLYGKRAEEILIRSGGLPSSKFFTIYNSLNYNECLKFRKSPDIGDFKNFRNQYFQDSNLPILVFIGRLNHIKRIDFLIESQKILHEKYGSVRFNILVIGDGEEMQNLKAQSRKYKLHEHIVFLSALYHEEDISKILLHSDLCVTPGEIGLTAIHSLSYGTPVISHDNLDIQMPEVEAIEVGITGDLYKYGSIESLAEKIDFWLNAHPYKNKELIQSCFKIIDKFYNPKYQTQVFKSVLLKS